MDTTQKTTKTAADGQNISNGAQSSVVKISPEYKLEKVAARPDQCRRNIEFIKLANTKRFGNCAVATNGRSLAVVPIEATDGENDCGLISVEALKASRKNKPLEGRLILNGDIEIPGGAVMPRPVECGDGGLPYPNWERILPAYPIKFEIGLNPKLLAELCEAIGAKDEIVRLSFSDELSPVVVTRSGSRTNGEYGVLMPGRLS